MIPKWAEPMIGIAGGLVLALPLLWGMVRLGDFMKVHLPQWVRFLAWVAITVVIILHAVQGHIRSKFWSAFVGIVATITIWFGLVQPFIKYGLGW